MDATSPSVEAGDGPERAAAPEASTTEKTTVTTTETKQLEATKTATADSGDNGQTSLTDASPPVEISTEDTTEGNSDEPLNEGGEECESTAARPKRNGELPEAGIEGSTTAPTLDSTFEELREEMTEPGGEPTKPKWFTKVADMFAMIYNTTSIKEKPQKADDGYPQLDAGEATELLELFNRIVIINKRPLAAWRKSVSDVCRDLHRSSWTVTNLIRKYADQARLDPNPVTSAWGRPRTAPTEGAATTDKPKFTFHDSGFAVEKQANVLEYCTRPFEFPVTLREPTDFKWEIVLALLEGRIIARHLPQFLRRICDAENLLSFQRTIVAQVEGELVGRLNDSTPIYKDHQSSNRIVDAVMQATRHRGTNTEKIFEMMKAIKAAAYNPATHALHFFFYTREEAAKWNGLALSFRMQTLKLVNVNGAIAGTGTSKSVWDRQLGSDGVPNAVTHSRYRVQLLNVSRLVEMHQLAEFLRKEIGA
ncbi:hypothetical protein FI667_g16394, partial [Globisporangium splendens]